MKVAILVALLLTTSAHAQLTTYGAAPSPSPALGRHFMDQPVAQCVVAKPCPYGDCVILQPCPPGTLAPPPAASQLPAPTPPAAPPVAAPKEAEPPREPVVIRIEVVPVPPESKLAPKAAPKPAPKKGACPC